MFIGYKSSKSKKILIMNSKGGAGKSSLTMAMARLFSSKNIKTELIDLDPQNTSYFWGGNNKEMRTQTFLTSSRVPFSLALKLELDTELTIIDTPSNFNKFELDKYLSLADKIILPLQASPIDLHSILGFIKNLIASPVYKKRNIPVCFVITRYKGRVGDLELMHRVLNKLKYPIIGVMSESDAYQSLFIDEDVKVFQYLDKNLWVEIERWINI